jgi:hypothetical protein
MVVMVQCLLAPSALERLIAIVTAIFEWENMPAVNDEKNQ